MKNKPLVSILCITYNHENYIEDAIKGFLIQETNFEFEILIHDDASTDNTQNIIKKYEKEYPNIIKVIYQKENQYSKGIKPLWEFLYPKTLGKYIAFCEGDDFWVDNLKLQKQVDLLEKNPDFKLVFHKSKRISNEPLENKIIGEYSSKTTKIPFQNILLRTKGMIPTASCVISRNAFDMTYKFMSENKYLLQGDIYMQYISAFSKGALYINEMMSIYRYRIQGSWTNKHNMNSNFKENVLFCKLKSFIALKKVLNLKNSNILSSIFVKYLFKLNFQISTTTSQNNNPIEQICKDLFLETIKANNISNNPVILFGASSLTKWTIQNFKNILNIQYILDSDISKHNLEFCEYKIQHISKVDINSPILFTLYGREYELEDINLNILHPQNNKIIYLKIEDIEKIYNQIQKLIHL
ncbi:putative glycosyltransferase EpsE [Aliarcobacter thereius]|uniref:Glycosyltransferase n=1 Tax=Aliarcobacter thereius TaxID=544718 RepID=A0A1C0B8N1_9BACT|nr:glycosyltransferase [Aliarcobacter thereius]OCL87499.1 putative glycosyltransferase EpsE [Aliarcobacter thereius]OCL99956.1 putative glycosyltransferase EpsE [Aliarcobacter thereius]TLS73348.1 glycosyltransferase [Aliarcobacter thereius]TLT08738.1 glycosyltransferase [Aliarcobacter thereius]